MIDITNSSILLRRLHDILNRQRGVLFLAGLLLTLTVATSIGLLLSFLANVMVLPVWLKLTLLFFSAGTAGYCFWRYSLARVFGGSVDQVALALEEKNPDLQGRLIAAVQFARLPRHPGFSGELIEQTERQAIEQAGLINLNEVVSFHSVLRSLRPMAVAGVIAVALIILFPGFFSYSYEVFSNPSVEVAPPLAYKIIPVPGSTEWIKYKDITIGAAVVGQRIPETGSVYHRLAGGNWQKTEINISALGRLSSASGDSLQIGLTLRQINKSFDYYVEAGRLKTEVQRIDVVDRPRVNNISLSIFYPEYTRLSPLTISENNGSFSAVVGSRVNIKVEANQNVNRAELVFSDSSHLPLSLTNGRVAEASLLTDKSISYHVRLEDHLGETNPDPIEYYITAIPDEYPSIDVIRPGFDANLNDDMILPLKVHIYDDFGFSSLVLKYAVISQGRASGENVAVLHFSDGIKTEGDVELNWDMDPLNMYPGDYTTYYFEVADNDRISGPKVTKSRSYIARIPSLDEVVAQTESEGQERISNTERMIQSGKELVQRLKNAARKLDAQPKESRKADWQQQKELESIAEKNAEMVKEVEKMAQKMDSSLEKMRDNALMSRELMEKMQQIQKLFEEVATPEMREAQRKLMEALQNMDRQKLQEAMKNMELSQKELMERLDRTLSLLKRLQVEQKMEAMMRQAEQLVQRQEKSNQQTDASPDKQLPSLSKAEDEINKSMQQLKKDVESLRELMKNANMSQSQEAQKFAEAIEKNTADQNMQSMSQSLNQSQKQDASKEGKEASTKLNQMLGEMQKQQMAMKGGDTEKIKQAMRRAMDDANYLSKSQEELLKNAADLDPRSSVLRDLAQNQQDLSSSCSGLKNTIGELGKQSPFVAAELAMILDQATRDMATAMQSLQDQQAPSAVQSQREAMSGLNKASVRLMESLEEQKKCDKAGSCDKNISKMESMCNKQNNLNQKTQGQCNNPGSNPGMKPGREGLERLAAEQGAIRKSVEQLEQEFGGSRQILGRLDDIAREMKKVEEDLLSGAPGQETTERQLKIYSRMLEASRSLQRKDFTEQRKSASPTEQPVYIPRELSSELLNDKTRFEDRLRQFLGDDYPSQYGEQIKAYFRALLQTETAPSKPAATEPGR